MIVATVVIVSYTSEETLKETETQEAKWINQDPTPGGRQSPAQNPFH